MKKVITLAAFIALLPVSCKTHKMVQSSRQEAQTMRVDSTAVTKATEAQTTQKDTSHVQKEAKTVETYKETNITILADDSKDINVPGTMHLDSSSTLDSLKYSNDKQPKTSLNIFRPTPTATRAVAKLTTPAGEQTFKNWKSITISSKEYKKVSTGKTDSAGASLVTKILKNSIDSGHKVVDSAKTVVVKQVIEKSSKTSFWGLMAGFWWIPVSLIALLLLYWKGGAIINWIKSKI